MRKILMIAAMLIAPGMAAGQAEAGDRGPGFRHAPPPLHAQPHFVPRGKAFHGRQFSHYRPAPPRRFGHSGGVVVFRFNGGGFGHRPAPYVKAHHFSGYHHRPVPAFGYRRPVGWGWHGQPYRHR
jgi:hypothetical protein